MISWIDSEQCKDNFIEVPSQRDTSDIIISPEEIMFLKQNDRITTSKSRSEILKNKHSNYLDSNLPENNNKKNNTNKESQTHLYEYNKLYLSFSTYGGISSGIRYFFKGRNRAFYLKRGLSLDERGLKSHEQELTREKVEAIFDKNNYDSMYIIDLNVGILFANTKKDGTVINRNIVPNDDEIIEREMNGRIFDYDLACIFNPKIKTEDNYKAAHTPKPIDEIKDLKIYGSAIFNNYAQLLITSKDGKFNIKWFSLTYLEKDKFMLKTTEIKVIEPTVEDVIEYSKEHEIEPYEIDRRAALMKELENYRRNIEMIESKELKQQIPKNTVAKRILKKVKNIINTK